MNQEQIDWDQVHLSNFESKAFWHIHWLYKADDLIATARLLEPEIENTWTNFKAHSKDQEIPLKANHYISTYFMLMAFAAENIFKAGIVFQRNHELKSEFGRSKRFPSTLQSHDLVKLAELANMKFGDDEEELLRRLSRSAIWHGRYPIPLEYKKLSGVERFSDGNEYSVSWNMNTDVKRINSFIEGLRPRVGLNMAEQG
jgi:hypothetical protein